MRFWFFFPNASCLWIESTGVVNLRGTGRYVNFNKSKLIYVVVFRNLASLFHPVPTLPTRSFFPNPSASLRFPSKFEQYRTHVPVQRLLSVFRRWWDFVTKVAIYNFSREWEQVFFCLFSLFKYPNVNFTFSTTFHFGRVRLLHSLNVVSIQIIWSV